MPPPPLIALLSVSFFCLAILTSLLSPLGPGCLPQINNWTLPEKISWWGAWRAWSLREEMGGGDTA